MATFKDYPQFKTKTEYENFVQLKRAANSLRGFLDDMANADELTRDPYAFQFENDMVALRNAINEFTNQYADMVFGTL